MAIIGELPYRIEVDPPTLENSCNQTPRDMAMSSSRETARDIWKDILLPKGQGPRFTFLQYSELCGKGGNT